MVAIARPFPYVELDQVISRRPRLLVVADQIQDPHNLGALIRTAEAVGAGAVILPKDGAVPITATVEAAAAGAAALEPVCRVTNVARTLVTLKQSRLLEHGLSPSGGLDLYQADLPQPWSLWSGVRQGCARWWQTMRCRRFHSHAWQGRISQRFSRGGSDAVRVVAEMAEIAGACWGWENQVGFIGFPGFRVLS